MPDAEAERVRAVMRELFDSGRFKSLDAFGDALGTSGSAVSQIIGGADGRGQKKNRPSLATASAVARLADKPEGFWKTDFVRHEIRQLDGVAIRFMVDERRVLVLTTNPPEIGPEAMRGLPTDAIRRAAIAAVFAFGVSFEVAAEAALSAYGGVAAPVRDDESFTADVWLQKMTPFLTGRGKRSGSYPRIQLAGSPPEPEPHAPHGATPRAATKAKRS